jgi:hypothetical protein
MLNPIRGVALVQLKNLLGGFLQGCPLPFGAVLTIKDVLEVIREELVETWDRIFTPLVTLCTFLTQIHSDDPSCRAAVARLNAARVAQGASAVLAVNGRLLQGPPTPSRVAATTAAGLKWRAA